MREAARLPIKKINYKRDLHIKTLAKKGIKYSQPVFICKVDLQKVRHNKVRTQSIVLAKESVQNKLAVDKELIEQVTFDS